MNHAELIGIIQHAAKTRQVSLDLSRLGLREIPVELGQLPDLKILNLSYNQLSHLSPILERLSSLKKLNLAFNRLSNLTLEERHLPELEVLNLSHNLFTQIPHQLLWLPKLIELDISFNLLSHLQPTIEQLFNLETLKLSNNRLGELVPEIGQLSRLKALSLSSNQLRKLPPTIGQLFNLETLDLSNNRLGELAPEIGQLSSLKLLLLAKNQLQHLPGELGNLLRLETLYLNNNRLQNLPRELGQLLNLKTLFLESNPLKFPPPELVEQGVAATLTYLREQEHGTQQWVSKLLVVGEGGVGKTSVLRALSNEPFDVKESTTRGIAIGNLQLLHPKIVDVTMQLNTWDFGGQEIYHATHQFFLTNRSLFLLVWNARLGWEQGKLIYWLKTIRANAPDSPIILVASHIDERDADLPLSELQQQFPQILGQWEISNRDGTGIEALRQTITNAAATLPLMGERWPTTWLNFANALRNSKQRYTTPQKFWGVMTQYEIKPESQSVLATWLHELGEILFFQDNDDLNDIVIFKPQWVTEHISRVLEADEVIRSNGIFTRACMERLWQDLEASMRNHFLRLMERFDLSYRTLENKDISLIVERLPFEPPDFEPLWDAKQQEANCKQILMKFQLSEVLPGIPTWFIARQHRFTIEQGERRGIHWRTGVLFQDQEQKHLALTRISRDDRTNSEYLQLTVRGAMPHSFFDLLKEGIELTLRRYPGLQITRLIPCPDPKQENCLHEFDYANLVKRLERTPPKEDIECPSCLENISVTQLLFGLHWTTQDAVLARLDSIQDGQSELRELVQSQFLRQFRQQQKLIESHCPNVFVLRPDDRSRLKKAWEQEIGTQRIYLQLYCQMPGCMHPTIDPNDPKKVCGLYPIDNPQQWLRAINPYYRRMVGVLKFATPLIGPWLGIMEAKDYQETFKHDIDLAKELAGKLPNLAGSDLDHAENILGGDRQVEAIDGAALRALRELLEKKDPSKQWGNLKQILTPEGDYLWLCEHHAKSFNP